MNFQKVVNIPVTNLYCEPEFGSEMATQCVLGVFYIWDGKVSSGIDYSGLVQSLFKLCVISSACDAWMQESFPSPGVFTNRLSSAFFSVKSIKGLPE